MLPRGSDWKLSPAINPVRAVLNAGFFLLCSLGLDFPGDSSDRCCVPGKLNVKKNPHDDFNQSTEMAGGLLPDEPGPLEDAPPTPGSGSGRGGRQDTALLVSA